MRHLVRSRSELQSQVTELVEQQAAISEVLRAVANSPHDLQPIFDTTRAKFASAETSRDLREADDLVSVELVNQDGGAGGGDACA